MNVQNVTVKLADFAHDRAAIYAIRKKVFQEEQGVDAALEFDGKDDTAVHFLAYLDTQPVGTARIRFLDASTAKLERLAVLPEARNQGIGRKIMETALEFLISKRIKTVKIHAQTAVKTFYQTLGFVVEGGIFEEAGIPHIKMSKQFASDLGIS
jgi:predicted GNAT family N-acyltransferase